MRRALLIAVGILLMGATVVGTLSRNQGFFSSLIVGSTGTTVTEHSVGSCALSTGTCAVSLSAVTAASLCVCSGNEASQAVVGCNCIPGAGTVTIDCQTTQTGNGIVICEN